MTEEGSLIYCINWPYPHYIN